MPPRAAATPALHAAARPRFDCHSTRSAYAAANESAASREPSSEPSTTTTTSYCSHGIDWVASDASARSRESFR